MVLGCRTTECARPPGGDNLNPKRQQAAPIAGDGWLAWSGNRDRAARFGREKGDGLGIVWSQPERELGDLALKVSRLLQAVVAAEPVRFGGVDHLWPQ